MKKIDPGQTITILANVGVIVGIVFLVFELRQNSDLMRAQTRMELARDTIDLITLNISNTAYLDAIDRGHAGAELTDVEATQYRRTYNAWIWNWNNLAYQYRVGLYDEAEYSLQINVVRQDIVRLPGLREHWCNNRLRNASPELVEAIESESDVNLC